MTDARDEQQQPDEQEQPDEQPGSARVPGRHRLEPTETWSEERMRGATPREQRIEHPAEPSDGPGAGGDALDDPSRGAKPEPDPEPEPTPDPSHPA